MDIRLQYKSFQFRMMWGNQPRYIVTEWQSFSDEIEYKQCMTSVMLKAYHWQSERGQRE